MARCCGGSSCACLIQAGEHIQIHGSGAAQDPFVVIGDVGLRTSDSLVFDLTLTGIGTASSPWTISLAYAATAKLDDVPDVNAGSPSNGQVLGWDSATSKWTPRAPTTAASGSVLHDASLSGDGSSGSILAVQADPEGFLATGFPGLGLSTRGKNRTVRHFVNTTDRDSASPPPDLNTLSMLDDTPGVQWYWNGVRWLLVTGAVAQSFDVAMLELSGSYVTGDPVTWLTRQVVSSTDASGVFEILSAADLATASGVLSVSFQETGDTPYKAMAAADLDRISGTAYRLDDGTVYALAPVTGVVSALIY